MRQFVRPGVFDLVCNLFTSFGYFRDEEDDLRVLANIHESLRNGGALVLEVVGKERLARTWQNAICSDLPDGSRLVQRPQLRDDWSRVSSEWTLIRGGKAETFSFEHSLYSGRELNDRLRSVGFGRVDLFGSLQGTPFDLNAARLVAVARKISA
jgi:SAM-dependent methyltransferase